MCFIIVLITFKERHRRIVEQRKQRLKKQRIFKKKRKLLRRVNMILYNEPSTMVNLKHSVSKYINKYLKKSSFSNESVLKLYRSPKDHKKAIYKLPILYQMFYFLIHTSSLYDKFDFFLNILRKKYNFLPFKRKQISLLGNYNAKKYKTSEFRNEYGCLFKPNDSNFDLFWKALHFDFTYHNTSDYATFVSEIQKVFFYTAPETNSVANMSTHFFFRFKDIKYKEPNLLSSPSLRKSYLNNRKKFFLYYFKGASFLKQENNNISPLNFDLYSYNVFSKDYNFFNSRFINHFNYKSNSFWKTYMFKSFSYKLNFLFRFSSYYYYKVPFLNLLSAKRPFLKLVYEKTLLDDYHLYISPLVKYNIDTLFRYNTIGYIKGSKALKYKTYSFVNNITPNSNERISLLFLLNKYKVVSYIIPFFFYWYSNDLNIHYKSSFFIFFSNHFSFFFKNLKYLFSLLSFYNLNSFFKNKYSFTSTPNRYYYSLFLQTKNSRYNRFFYYNNQDLWLRFKALFYENSKFFSNSFFLFNKSTLHNPLVYDSSFFFSEKLNSFSYTNHIDLKYLYILKNNFWKSIYSRKPQENKHYKTSAKDNHSTVSFKTSFFSIFIGNFLILKSNLKDVTSTYFFSYLILKYQVFIRKSPFVFLLNDFFLSYYKLYNFHSLKGSFRGNEGFKTFFYSSSTFLQYVFFFIYTIKKNTSHYNTYKSIYFDSYLNTKKQLVMKFQSRLSSSGLSSFLLGKNKFNKSLLKKVNVLLFLFDLYKQTKLPSFKELKITKGLFFKCRSSLKLFFSKWLYPYLVNKLFTRYAFKLKHISTFIKTYKRRKKKVVSFKMNVLKKRLLSHLLPIYYKKIGDYNLDTTYLSNTFFNSLLQSNSSNLNPIKKKTNTFFYYIKANISNYMKFLKLKKKKHLYLIKSTLYNYYFTPSKIYTCQYGSFLKTFYYFLKSFIYTYNFKFSFLYLMFSNVSIVPILSYFINITTFFNNFTTFKNIYFRYTFYKKSVLFFFNKIHAKTSLKRSSTISTLYKRKKHYDYNYAASSNSLFEGSSMTIFYTQMFLLMNYFFMFIKQCCFVSFLCDSITSYKQVTFIYNLTDPFILLSNSLYNFYYLEWFFNVKVDELFL